MSAARVISLIGLPGAGKTTLGKALAALLGPKCTYFGVGEALRHSAGADLSLREHLGDGRLGPEAMVSCLVTAAHASCATELLILDGFPRHAGQVPFAVEKFQQWQVLYLEIKKGRAAARLSRRHFCEACGTPAEGVVEPCLRCGAQTWKRRAEDSDVVVSRRLDSAEVDVRSLLESLETTARITRLDGTMAADSLLNLVLAIIP